MEAKKQKLIQKFNALADEFVQKTKYRPPYIIGTRRTIAAFPIPIIEKAVENAEEMNKTYYIEKTREMVKMFEDGCTHAKFVDGAWEITDN